MRKLIAVVLLASTAGLLGGCGDDTDALKPTQPVATGSAAILAKRIPAEFIGIILTPGSIDGDGGLVQPGCILDLAHPGYANWRERLMGYFLSMGITVAMRTQSDEISLVAHREKSGWVVDLTNIDPGKTTADELDHEVQECLATLNDQQQQALDAENNAAKNTATWAAAASAVADAH
jgi:hypothetical protein